MERGGGQSRRRSMDVTFTDYQLEEMATEVGEEPAQVDDEDC